MNVSTIASVALAVVLISAGAVGGVAGSTAAVAQADSPDEADTPDEADDNRQDDEPENESAANEANESNETRDAHANDTGNATAEQARDERGPPTDMPEPVPAFVSDLHEQIWEHLNGNISGAELGEALSSLTPGRDTAAPADQADDHRQDGDETPTPTPTESDT